MYCCMEDAEEKENNERSLRCITKFYVLPSVDFPSASFDVRNSCLKERCIVVWKTWKKKKIMIRVFAIYLSFPSSLV